MELSPTWKEEDFVPWLTVKSRIMGPDSGLGVFADCQFHKLDNITVYFGERADPNNPDCSRQLEVRNSKFLDIQPNDLGR